MYNRYIPQADGSYRKSQVPDASVQRQRPRRPAPPPKPKPETNCNQAESCPTPCKEVHSGSSRPQEHHSAIGAGDFLRRLLPKDLDTGDLLVIILLLLMAGDCKEEKNTALLTLALYMMM